MRYQSQIRLGEFNYTIHQFPATKALKVLTRLTKLLGEPMSGMAFTKKSTVAEFLPKVMASLTEKIEEEEVTNLVLDLISSVSLNGQPLNFDTHFQGAMGHLFKLLMEVLKVQYGDFLGAITVAPRVPVKAAESA